MSILCYGGAQMVLYYSATGNTEYIAKEIAKRLDDTCIDLLDRIKKDDFENLHSDKPFIICAPVYVCEMPRFLSKAAVSSSRGALSLPSKTVEQILSLSKPNT